jgi:hypothetical protein
VLNSAASDQLRSRKNIKGQEKGTEHHTEQLNSILSLFVCLLNSPKVKHNSNKSKGRKQNTQTKTKQGNLYHLGHNKY